MKTFGGVQSIFVVKIDGVEYVPLTEVRELIMSHAVDLKKLEDKIAERSCCCAGCTKHNIALENRESNGEFQDE